MAVSTKKAYIRDIYIDNTGAMGIWIKYADDGDACTSDIYVKGISVRGVEPDIRPKALLGSGVTLASLRVNDCYLLLFMELIFTSKKGVNYWDR